MALYRLIRSSTLVQTLRRLDFFAYVCRMMYQANKAGTRSPLWGATLPQHQTMIHSSAEMRNLITLPQINLIEWLAYQITLALQEEHICCHCQGVKWGLHVHLKSAFFRVLIQLCTSSYVHSITIKMTMIVLISHLAMATYVFLLKR